MRKQPRPKVSSDAPVTVDFETEPIDARPNYPPKPVGVSIKFPNKPAVYFAFGHPTANNCTFEEARAALTAAWAHPSGILCHNAKFDLDVAEVHFGLILPAWSRIHDTMIEVFLDNPHAPSHALKPSAERLLGMPSEERDELKEWLVKAGFITKASKNWGAFICKAPGDLVGKYANGDVERTELIHAKLAPTFVKRKMQVALDRERKLLPILLDMERQGVPVDQKRLFDDVARYTKELDQLSRWIQTRLKAPKVNLDSAAELVEALIAAKKVDTDKLGKTKKGAWKTDKAALDLAVSDRTLVSALAHRASLNTCLNTFMAPWLRTALLSGGLIFTTWNQLKQYNASGSEAFGAVTGRMSSSPNFQNIPNEFPAYWKHEEALLPEEDRKGLPECPLKLTALPLVRSYVVAFPEHTLIDRDYSQQELRILAHYEYGQLMQAYLTTPWMDVHEVVTNEINAQLGTAFKRKVIKQINFGLIYGMGIALMGIKAGCSPDEARKAKWAVLDLYPGLRELQDGLKDLAFNDKPLRTWGGRLYHCEPSKTVIDETTKQERAWSFEYKMLNVLVQGSAADCTKDAIINYYATKPKDHRLLLTVHDELLCSVPSREVDRGMEVLRAAMEDVKFDVAMLSEGDVSTTNWAELKTYDEKGKRV